MTRLVRKAACIGGGVIGGGWAARFVLSGHDVTIYDPHEEAQRKVGEVLVNAERAYAKLTMAPLPKRGRLNFAKTLEEAVADADWIQESVPERLDLKQKVHQQIDAAARPDALIGSSTSGLLPSDMQAGLRHPERMFVAHPFNPVYLLPLVELVGGAATSTQALDRAKADLAEIGMKGVAIEHEIEAFVADRLMEALWREALWLVKDGVATTGEIDDIMRYSFGLRWAQMGLFQTFQIAGGEAGMRHFLHQFGPALHWPWTKLTDVPELTEELIETIASQCDACSGELTVRDLERLRDDNLVAILQALKGGDNGRGWGAGKLLKEFEDWLWADRDERAGDLDLSGPLRLIETTVNPAWLDYNGHMTEFRYLQVLGETTDALLHLIGVDMDYVGTGGSYYTVETHIRHLGEARLGAPLYATCQVLSADEKRLHLFHRIHKGDGDAVIATGEHLLLHVEAGRAAPATASILDKLMPIAEAHARLDRPEGAGRRVGERR